MHLADSKTYEGCKLLRCKFLFFQSIICSGPIGPVSCYLTVPTLLYTGPGPLGHCLCRTLLYRGSSIAEKQYRGSELRSLKHLFTASSSVCLEVLSPWSDVSFLNSRFKASTEGITSAVVAVAEHMSLVNCSNGSSRVTMFSIRVH